MSLASGVVNNPAIDNLVQSSLESEHDLRLEWIPYEKFTDIKPTQIDNVYCASRRHYEIIFTNEITLIFLGNNKECSPTLVSELARIYSLPTHKYKNNVSKYRRYSRWLTERNKLIDGFTKYKDK